MPEKAHQHGIRCNQQGTPAWDLVQSAQMQESAFKTKDANEGTPAGDLVQPAQMQDASLERRDKHWTVWDLVQSAQMQESALEGQKMLVKAHLHGIWKDKRCQ